MGMRERQVLTQVELPLSWPLIFAGIRTASVYVIATAPLAALAGGGGLGDIIVNQPTYGLDGVIAATIVVVALAFAVDGLLGARAAAPSPRAACGCRRSCRPSSRATDVGRPGRRAPDRRTHRGTRGEVHMHARTDRCCCDSRCSPSSPAAAATTTARAAAAAAAAAARRARDQPGKGKPAVTIGTKDFTEEFILGELYEQALEAKGYNVNLKKNIGADRDHRQGADVRHDRRLPRVHRRVARGVRPRTRSTTSPEETGADAKKLYEDRGQTVERRHAVPGHRRDRRDQGRSRRRTG